MTKTKNTALKHTGAFWMFVLPSLLLFTVFFMIPLFLSIWFSFTNYDGWKTMDFVGLKNYITALTNADFYKTLGRTLLYTICNLPFKTDLREYKEWDIRTTMECGAKIVLNTAVTREMVEREEPDALFIAAGATPLTPPVPGIEFAKQVIEVDNDRVEVGDTVVVCGDGLSGLECALALAMKGKKVTVVDMIPVENFGSGQVRPSHVMLMKLLADHNVTLIGNSKVQEIREHSVVIMDRNWKVTELPADTTVASFGMRSNMAAAQELSGIIAETYIIGDNDRVANLLNANMTAFDYAVEC